MKKIIAYTRSGKVSPSSNYRIIQYVDEMTSDVVVRSLSSEYTYVHHANARKKVEKIWWHTLYYGQIQLRLFWYMCKDLLHKPQCIIVQRAISPKIIFVLNKYLVKKVYSSVDNLIWDFDDEIMNSKEITGFEYNLFLKYAKTVVVTSEYLKSRLKPEMQNKVLLLPTTDKEFALLNMNECFLKRKETYDKQIELLWLATSPSLPYLQSIIIELDFAAKEIFESLGKKVILHVVCNKPLVCEANYLKINNIVWSRGTAKKMVERAHIGLMPLVNSISCQGKGGFKIIQYMSAGIPAVASAIGYNKEVIINGETGFLVDGDNVKWSQAIYRLSENWEFYIKSATLSRMEWDKKFSFDSNLTKWESVIFDMNGE